MWVINYWWAFEFVGVAAIIIAMYWRDKMYWKKETRLGAALRGILFGTGMACFVWGITAFTLIR